jgi:hypothetical protein
MSQEIKISLFKKLEIISPFYHKKKAYLHKKLTFYQIKSYFLLEVQQIFCVSTTKFLCVEILFVEIFLFRQNL